MILLGDCLQTLPTLPAGSFHCCVTSPPYWNLRSYLPQDHADKPKEIGSENTPDEFIATMVRVFREVRRVLRDDGVLWVNLGDSFADDGNQQLMPHKVAMALQADGWVLRSAIVWHKPSPTPESLSGVRWRQCRVKVSGCGTIEGRKNSNHQNRTVAGLDRKNSTDDHEAKWSTCPGCEKCRDTGGLVLRRGRWRPTCAHEYVFMFAKTDKYFCDGDAVAEQSVGETPGNRGMGKYDGYTTNDAMHRRQLGKTNGSLTFAVEQRNPRSVWTISSEPYRESHFATFPSELARRCIAASTSKAGCCTDCGAPYAPVVHSERVPTRPGINNQIDPAGMANRDPQRHVAVNRVTGYLPTCTCPKSEPARCRVLDPFGGSGTVGQVAHHMGLDYVLCELNPAYVPLIESRIEEVPNCLRKPDANAVRPLKGQLKMGFAF